MSRLLVVLAFPAALLAQNPPAPRPLTATRIYHIPGDSARAAPGGAFLLGSNGSVFAWRYPSPLPNGSFHSLPVTFSVAGVEVTSGRDGPSRLGEPTGWVGSPALDSLWVQLGDTVAVLAPDRHVVRVARVPNSTTWSLHPGWVVEYMPRAVYPDGTLLVYGIPLGDPPPDSVRKRFGDGVLLRTNSRGDVQRTVAILPWPAQCYVRDKRGKEIPLSYCSPPRFDVSQSGSTIAEVFAEPGKPGFAVVSLSSHGDTNFRVHLEIPPPAIPNSVLKAILARLDTSLTREVFDTVHISRTRNAFGNVLVGDDGTVWVAISDAPRADHAWIELDRRGRVVGKLVLPEAIQLQLVSADQVWGLEYGDDFKFGVVGYRIGRP